MRWYTHAILYVLILNIGVAYYFTFCLKEVPISGMGIQAALLSLFIYLTIFFILRKVFSRKKRSKEKALANGPKEDDVSESLKQSDK